MLRRGDAWVSSLALDDVARERLLTRYLRPEPRLDIGEALRHHAHAAMDISDGLLKDLGRMADASRVAARIDALALPLDMALRPLIAEHGRLMELALTGGDDYEVLAAVPPDRAEAFEAAAQAAGCPVARIGSMTEGTGVTALDRKGEPLIFSRSGWDHFQ